MPSTKRATVFKVFALFLALGLSGAYVFSEWRDQDEKKDKDFPMSRTRTSPPRLIEALPKRGPIQLGTDNFNSEQAEANPPGDGYQDPGERPLYPWKELEEHKAPGFDLNDALSKTGTIRLDSLIDDEDEDGGDEPNTPAPDTADTADTTNVPNTPGAAPQE